MWRRFLIIIFLFYIFALLQSSFFVYFSFLGVVPNLVFILFFLLVFFVDKGGYYQVVSLAVIAGILLDIFSHIYLGPAIFIFLIIGFLLKQAQSMLKYGANNKPFSYFLLLFAAFFVAYEVLSMIYLRFIDLAHTPIVFDLRFLAGTIYSLFFASLLFYLYKRWGKYIA